MKVTIEVDCSPDEARQFMGLPDVEQANAIYIDHITNAMKGVTSTEQLDQFAKQLAPMGQMGMKIFQSFFENAQSMNNAAMKTPGSGSKS